MGTPPTTTRGRATRDRIIAAAVAVVAEKGASAASLDEVGARAPASRSQLYHYFSDKHDLLLAVATTTNDTVIGGQATLLAADAGWDGLVRWADALVAFQTATGGVGGCPIANLLGQLGERDEPIRDELASGFDRWETTIRDCLASMASAGELDSSVDVAFLARSTLASVQGGLTLTQAHREPQFLRTALDGALTLIDHFRVSSTPPTTEPSTAGHRA